MAVTDYIQKGMAGHRAHSLALSVYPGRVYSPSPDTILIPAPPPDQPGLPSSLNACLCVGTVWQPIPASVFTKPEEVND